MEAFDIGVEDGMEKSAAVGGLMRAVRSSHMKALKGAASAGKMRAMGSKAHAMKMMPKAKLQAAKGGAMAGVGSPAKPQGLVAKAKGLFRRK